MYGINNYSAKLQKINALNNYKNTIDNINQFIKTNKLFLSTYIYKTYKLSYINLLNTINIELNKTYNGNYELNNKDYIEIKITDFLNIKKYILDSTYYKDFTVINDYFNKLTDNKNKFNESYNKFLNELILSCKLNNNTYKIYYDECVNLYNNLNK